MHAFQGMDVGIIRHLPRWHDAAAQPPQIIGTQRASRRYVSGSSTEVGVVHSWSPGVVERRNAPRVYARIAQRQHDTFHCCSGEIILLNRVTDFTIKTASLFTAPTWQQITMLPCSIYFNDRYFFATGKTHEKTCFAMQFFLGFYCFFPMRTGNLWGLRVCSLDVAFMFATVGNRSQPSARTPYGRASGKFCKRVTFGRFACCVASFRVAGVALRDIQTNVSKVVSCGRRNTFATFSENVWQFSWQAQHFGCVHRHFAWQAQHFRRVVLRVFANRIAKAAL